jgi:cell division transport system ATP-binding protein
MKRKAASSTSNSASTKAAQEPEQGPEQASEQAAPAGSAPAQSGVIVELDQVSLSYGEHAVLENVSFQVARGDFVYLIGRTGSGKSSLLKLLYGDVKPDSGSIRIEDYQLEHIRNKEIPYLRRRIGIVFQSFELLPDRSVADNLYFVMRATGWKSPQQMKSRATEVLMQVGLSSKINHMPHQLSGGEQQRTVLARALINDPVLILADEPTGNLDPEVTNYIMEILHKINRGGTGVLMATHEHELIRNHPGRVLECTDGRVYERTMNT